MTAEPTAEPRAWGVYCEAAMQAHPRWLGPAPPRYAASTKAEAQRLKRQADRECQSKAKHYVRRIEEDPS